MADVLGIATTAFPLMSWMALDVRDRYVVREEEHSGNNCLIALVVTEERAMTMTSLFGIDDRSDDRFKSK